jgi:O-antigen/teichoic acid export membrane protein
MPKTVSGTPNQSGGAGVEHDERLTKGLARSTLFNVLGWAFPLAISMATMPYVVRRLGMSAFGVFSVVSVIAGYAGALKTPATDSGTRFIAEAYVRRNWSAMRSAAIGTLAVTAAFSAFGAALMIVGAPFFVSLFKLEEEMREPSMAAFRLGSVAFFFNALTSGLGGMLAAVRRYDLLSVFLVASRVLMVTSIVAALWLGTGLLGAMWAQVIATLAALVAHSACVTVVLGRLSPLRWERVPRETWKRLGSFSIVLLAASLASVVGLQLDRVLVGAALGAAAVGYFSIASRLTDALMGLIASLTTALYPLSAEASAAGKLPELKDLYVRTTRLLTWLSALMAALLAVPARDLLTVWMGAEVADRSWSVLALLALSAIWRAPSSVAFRVCNGLGRGDLSFGVAWGTLICVLVFVLLLIPPLGLTGAALGTLLGVIPLNVAYDLVVQRRLLAQNDWRISTSVYAKPLCAVLVCGAASLLVPLDGNLAAIAAKVALVVAVFALAVHFLDRAASREILRLAHRLTSGSAAAANPQASSPRGTIEPP